MDPIPAGNLIIIWQGFGSATLPDRDWVQGGNIINAGAANSTLGVRYEDGHVVVDLSMALPSYDQFVQFDEVRIILARWGGNAMLGIGTVYLATI